ncbi:hypothetical protein I4U23_020402 [Adineta vaga]|nr:hypothetical protein I4U23_020402 [Adineta vaga]
MDKGIVDDIAVPVNIEVMALEQTHNDEKIEKNERKNRRRHRKCLFLPWPLLCLLLTALGLLAAALAALMLRKRDFILVVANTTNDTYMDITVPTITYPSTTPFTTTPLICGPSCLNQSWIDDSSILAQWSFEGIFTDKTGVYNGRTSTNLPTFTTGFIGQAVYFNASTQQAIYTPHIPLNEVSFTIEAWIKPTGYQRTYDLSIVGSCPSLIVDHCLHINIRNRNLYFGFYYDDIQGGTYISFDQWMHVAFVFDITTKLQTIYLNGFINGKQTSQSALLVSSGDFTIGTNAGVNYPDNFFQGYMDEIKISGRAKSSCEILEQATLAAYFKFDRTSAPYIDSGPNKVLNTFSTTSIINGYKNQAISLSGTSQSYFQTWGFTSFGISNQPFSIVFWIRPQSLVGTLVHLSTSASGTGSTCFPLLGFSSNGSIVAQVLTSNNVLVSAIDPNPASTSSWIFVVQTWSSTGGLKLYINNILVSTSPASTFLASETTPNYFTLGNCLSGCTECSKGFISAPGPFLGSIDDWRIFNRELTIDDVCTLYTAH